MILIPRLKPDTLVFAALGSSMIASPDTDQEVLTPFTAGLADSEIGSSSKQTEVPSVKILGGILPNTRSVSVVVGQDPFVIVQTKYCQPELPKCAVVLDECTSAINAVPSVVQVPIPYRGVFASKII